MKMKASVVCILLALAFVSCHGDMNRYNMEENIMEQVNWKHQLQDMLPLLGHRNWIVITDMAYPLQTQPGILTLYATEEYEQVVTEVDRMIKAVPHVFAHIYQDSERRAMSEALCPGWDKHVEAMGHVFAPGDVEYVPHEELIQRLDSVSKLFRVVIIKTNLDKPYTSTFFELDCKYWDAGRERAIRMQ